MTTKLKLALETAIEQVIENVENPDWPYYIHSQLVRQMTNAAEMVFDASQDGQEYFASETKYN